MPLLLIRVSANSAMLPVWSNSLGPAPDMSLRRAVSARRRVFTENLGAELLILAIGVLLAFVPGIVNLVEHHFRHDHSLYLSFAKSLEEFYLGALAVALTAILNYFEWQFLDKINLGRACGIAAGFTVLFALLCLIGYFLVHFLGEQYFESTQDGRGVVNSSIAFLVLVTTSSSLTVLQGRRSKDVHRGREA
jgi:hypothetical protein